MRGFEHGFHQNGRLITTTIWILFQRVKKQQRFSVHLRPDTLHRNMDFKVIALFAFAIVAVGQFVDPVGASKSKGDSTPASCDSGWTLAGTKCIQAVATGGDWDAAKTGCANLKTGAKLACITSNEVYATMILSAIAQLTTSTSNYAYWTGINDIAADKGTSRDGWTCVDDTAGPGNYSLFWQAGEPDSTANTACTYLTGEELWTLKDLACTTSWMDAYFCEYAL